MDNNGNDNINTQDFSDNNTLNNSIQNMGMQGNGSFDLNQPNMGPQNYGQMGSGPLNSNQPNIGPQNYGQMGSGPLNSNQPNMEPQNYGQMGSGPLNSNQPNMGPQNYSQGPQNFNNQTYTVPQQQMNMKSGNSGLSVAALILSILGCTFIIGAILAIIDLTKKDGKSKTLSKVALGICGAWLLIGMIRSIGKKNDGNKDVAVEVTTEVATESTSEVVEVTTEATTETTTEADAQTKNINKSEKNGFNVDTNNTVNINGFVMDIPQYFGSKSDDSTDVLHYYYAESGEKTTLLMIQSSDDSTDEIGFEGYVEKYMESFSAKLEDYNEIDKKYTTVNGLSCYTSHFSSSISGYTIDSVIYLFSNSESNKILTVVFGESENSDYTYFSDVEKIINTVQYTNEAKEENNKASGISQDFKDMMDAYEEFMDEYIEVMELYKQDPSDSEVLSKYFEFLTKYAEYSSTISNLDESEMTDEEAAYYLEVTSRVTQKLLEAGLSE